MASAKVVDPGGDVLATTGTDGRAWPWPSSTWPTALDAARRSMGHLRDMRPDAYTPAGRRRPKRPGRGARGGCVTVLRLAAAAAHFSRDLDFDLSRIGEDHRRRP